MKEKSNSLESEANVVAGTLVADLQIPDAQCRMDAYPEPCAIIILGASGDLTAKKLMPALYNLFEAGVLPNSSLIVGCARTEYTDEAFREKMKRAVFKGDPPDKAKWKRFEGLMYYLPFAYDEKESYDALSESLSQMEVRHNTKGNRLFYLALPSSQIETVINRMGASGLHKQTGDRNWSRIVIEKPFGLDLTSAVKLDRLLQQYFSERQVFRMDHYLAKETVQNILMFRFANAIFEPLWNRNYIDYVKIVMLEDQGIGNRAGYYEQAGVLRDMIQNHMMQLLALVAMEPPPIFESNQVRDEKTKIFRSLRPFLPQNMREDLILGQYTQGNVDGKDVPGYLDEPGVNPSSLVPTFAMFRTYVDNWRWKGIPFYLVSGKRMEKKITEVIIQFKAVPFSLFGHILGAPVLANRLVLSIHPDEKITLSFQTKNPGARVCLRTVTMDFFYHQNYTGPKMDAYEKALVDCILGEQMLFWRQDAVELAWSFMNPVIKQCETCGDRAQMLHLYAAGSEGPKPYVAFLNKLAP